VTLRAACRGRASPRWHGSARQPPAKREVTAAARRARARPAPGVRSLPRGSGSSHRRRGESGRLVRRRGCHLVTSVGRGQVSWKPGLAYTMPAWLPVVHPPCRERVVPSTGTIMSWEATSWEQSLFPRGAIREPPVLHLGGTRPRRHLMSVGSVLARLRCSRRGCRPQEDPQVLLGLADGGRDRVHIARRQVAGAEARCRDHAGELSFLVAGHPCAHHGVA
jgi:hypothetical protein